MKLILILVAYLFFGCSSSQQVSSKHQASKNVKQVKKLILKSPPTKIEESTLKSILECDKDIPESITPAQLATIRTNDLLGPHWKKLFSSAACAKTIEFFAKNGVTNSNIMAMHELLSGGNKDLLKALLKTNFIAENIQSGTETQLRTLMSRLYESKTLKIYDFEIQTPLVSEFLKIRNERTPKTAPESKLEEWIIGKEYYICGFYMDAEAFLNIWPVSNDKSTSLVVPSCTKKDAPYVKVVDLDKDWLYFKKKVTTKHYKDDEEIEEVVETEFKTLRQFITTPYVLTDGKINIAISEDGIQELIIGEKKISTIKSQNCDDAEINVLLKFQADDYFNDRSSMEYPLPRGFQKEKAKVLKHFYGGIYHEEECSGC